MAKKQKPSRGPQLDLAGDLGIAFVNTASEKDWNFQQGFSTYAELVVWAQQAGLLETAAAERLRRLAAERPVAAEEVATRALELRRSLFRVVAAFADERELDTADLEPLNAALETAMPAVRVVPGETGLTWGWGGDEDALDRMLWPAVRSAAELLTALDDKTYIRQCARKECTLFFVTNLSRRRWCGSICRNRTKSLTYYYRHEREKRDSGMRAGGWWHHKRPRKRRFS